jgi:hypothetical protein
VDQSTEDVTAKQLTRRCRVGTGHGKLNRDLRPGLDRHGEFVERDGHPPARWLSDRQLIVPAPNVLD